MNSPKLTIKAGHCLLLILFACLPFFSTAQVTSLKLATGEQKLSASASDQALKDIKERSAWQGRYFWIASFSALPSADEKKQWEKEGTQFHLRLDNQTYYISSPILPTADWLKQHRVSQTAVINPSLKFAPNLAFGRFPAEARDESGLLKVLVAVQPNLSLEEVKSWLRQNKFNIEPSSFEKNRILTIHASANQLQELAALPFTVYLQAVHKDKLLNEKSRFMSGAFAAQAPLSNGGHNLRGNGVVVGVGDVGDGLLHPDLMDRTIDRSGGVVGVDPSNGHDHGSHVSGTVAGAGILQPDRKGLAPEATLISQFLSGIWLNAAAYVQDFGMVLTNNSYGAVEGDCYYYGIYDLYSSILDQQAEDLPELLNVFAAGNSGGDVCGPFVAPYHTVLGSYQSAKNVITVGRTDYDQFSTSSSSCGPVFDGRLKPEIASLGIVESTNYANGYYGDYGTSMACPGITGALALLYERYRQLFSGSNPKGALMKAILLNGARDIDTKGPDFKHGYGYVHIENSLRMLDDHKYFGGDMTQGGTKDSVITVPAGTGFLKVMLYWHDPAASPLATKALVNDLDLEVILPDGSTVVYPKKLNPAAGSVTLPATEGPDHINNSEQVIIETPVAGNYTIRVKGYEVLATPSQSYFTAFDYVPQGLKIRTPFTGDTWSVSAPDEYAVTGVDISWDDEATASGGTYTLEYSLDNGGIWTTVPADNAFPGIPLVLKDTCRYYGWRPPTGTATNQALVRITKNSTSFTATSGVFSILNRPLGVSVSNPCESYLTVTWSAVTGADDYEVIMKQGTQMVPIGVVTPPAALSYTISGLNKDSAYCVSVRARKAGIPGRWIQASIATPKNGACSGSISDGDLKLDSIIAPVSGRQLTSTALGASENLKVRIKNLDDVTAGANSYEIKYSLDGASYITDAVTPAIGGLSTYVHTFSGLNLSATGTHTITAVVKNTAVVDNVPKNDTFTVVIKNLPNALVTPLTNLATSFKENFDAAPAASYSRSTVGLDNLDRWDYFNSDKYARARTFVNTGIALSGNRAITLDVSRDAGAPPTVVYLTNPANNLQATVNLSGNTTADEVRLDFNYKQHGTYQQPNAQNKVWIRGSDADSWVPIYDLSANQPDEAGIWKKSNSIELNDLMAAAPQNFSTSTQIRFGQYAWEGMADNTHLAGYTFDDIRLYLATNDMQVPLIDEPAIYSCGLNNAVPIKITIYNSMSAAASNVPVSYTIDGGTAVTEIIPSIPGNGAGVYSFGTPANLSVTGTHIIKAYVAYPGDNVPDNDTAIATIVNQPVISSFPYLEDFEAGAGAYYTSGIHSSWQWGVPASLLIDTAASGTKAWKTTLKGNYNDNEYSYLNTPCFDIHTLTNPTLSFSFAYDIEDCSVYGPSVVCDAGWAEYSTDGINWIHLGAFGQGTNWYDNSANSIWEKRKQTYWHAATIPLPVGVSNLRIRFIMYSDDGTNYEGMAIDDIHIYDLPAPMYTSTGTSAAVTLPVSGTAPVDFTDGGKLIATLLPNNNNIGSTEVKAYIYNGAVRNNSQQYYGNRNITIKPTNNPAGNVTVRFYFSDKEVNALRLATGCPSCTKPGDYTHLGVTKYTDPNKTFEDGDLANNINGLNTFIYGNDIRLIPYDSGYYAEFDVSNFSEFWLNDGRDSNVPLPTVWANFKAIKQSDNIGKLTWSISNESNIRYYEIQSAVNKDAANAGQFTTISTANAKNTNEASYVYFDDRAAKKGDYYYRIRQVDNNGKSIYSPVRLLHFGKQNFEVNIYPNPVKNNLLLTLQSDENKKMQVKILNMAGQVLHTQSWFTTGNSSQLAIPLNKLALSNGVYTVGVSDGGQWQYFKIVKAE